MLSEFDPGGFPTRKVKEIEKSISLIRAYKSKILEKIECFNLAFLIQILGVS